jgi:hypothetical protein
LKIFKREKRRKGKMRNLKKVFAIPFLFILLGLVFVKLTGKWSHIDKKGKKYLDGICPPELIPYREGDKWGFCDRNKKIVIPCKYDDVEDFSEGLAPVELYGKWGFVDKEGKEVIPIKYDGAGSFSKGLACVELYGKYGYIDKEGTEYFVFVGSLKEVVTNIVEEWLQVQKRGESGDIYWTKPRLAKSLYAVREWEIVNCSISENTASVTVRISSSTKKRFSNYKTFAFYS